MNICGQNEKKKKIKLAELAWGIEGSPWEAVHASAGRGEGENLEQKIFIDPRLSKC